MYKIAIQVLKDELEIREYEIKNVQKIFENEDPGIRTYRDDEADDIRKAILELEKCT